jgi:predicted nucleotidyltransferase component of viral defense system
VSGAKQLAASVKARLQNVAAKRGDEFNLVLTRYGIERLLFRLSRSPHADRFLVKGAMLFLVWDDKTHRPTRDLDLLGLGKMEKAELDRIFREIAATRVPDDGLIFDPDSVQSDAIREANAYGGTRVRLMGKLGHARIPMQIDVGAGDAVTPAPERAVFPVLLDFPAPHVRVYPIYTVVAEKFEAVVKLGAANTRMKDFYDLWFLSQRFEFDREILRRAVEATLARRQTDLSLALVPFSDEFASDATKQSQWFAFHRRNSLSGASDQFSEVMALLRKFFTPFLRR